MNRAKNLYRRSPETASTPARPQVFRLIDVEGKVLPPGGYEQFADDPIGWDKINILLTRGKEHGVNYEFTDGEVALEFDVATGRELIDRIYAQAGSDGIIGFEYGYLGNIDNVSGQAENYYRAADRLRAYKRHEIQGQYIKLIIDLTFDEYNWIEQTADFRNRTMEVAIEDNPANNGIYSYYQFSHLKYTSEIKLWLYAADLPDPDALENALVRITFPNETAVFSSATATALSEKESFVTYFAGKLNLNEAEFVDYAVICPVERSDFEDRLRTRYSTKINFSDPFNLDGEPLDSIPDYQVLLPVKPEYLRSKFRQPNGIEYSVGAGNSESSLFYIVPQFGEEVTNEVPTIWNPTMQLHGSPIVTRTNGVTVIDHPEAIFFTADQDGLYTFDLQTQAQLTMARENWAARYDRMEWGLEYLRIYDPGDGQDLFVTSFGLGDLIIYDERKTWIDTQTFQANFTLFLQAGEEIYFYYVVLLVGKNNEEYDIRMDQLVGYTNRIIVTAETAARGSGASAYLIYDVLSHLLRSTTDSNAQLRSDFFGLKLHGYAQDGQGGRNMLLMGEDVRNRSNASFITSYESVYESLNALFCIGQAVVTDAEGTPSVRIENVEYFYREAEIMRINVASNYREMVATDLIYNEIEVGYKKYLEEETDTLDSVHTRQQYLTPIRSYKKLLKIICEFIADPYALEHTRREQFSTEERESWRYDDDLFLLAVQSGLRETYYVRKIGETGTRPSGETFALLFLNVDGKSVYNKLAGISDLKMTVVGADGSEQVREINNMAYSLDPGNYLFVVPSGPALTYEEANLVILSSELGGFSTERSEAFQRVDGIESAASFVNLRHTPQRMLHRWAVWINSMLSYKESDDQIKNTFTKNNREAVTQLPTDDFETRANLNQAPIYEGSNIPLLGFNNFNRLFTPEYIEFEAPITWQQIQLLRDAHQGQATQANYGYISVIDYNGDLKQGYLQELVYNPVDEQARFKLLKKSDQPICNLSVQVVEGDGAFTFAASETDNLEFQIEGTDGTLIQGWSTADSIQFSDLSEGDYKVRARVADNPDCEAVATFTYTQALALLHLRDFVRYNNEQWYEQKYVYGISRIKNEGNASGEYTISVTLNGTTARLLRGPSANALTKITAVSGALSFSLQPDQEEFFALEIDNQTGASQDVIIEVFDADGNEILSDGNRQSLAQITVRPLVLVCDIDINVVRNRGQITIQHAYDSPDRPTEYQVVHPSGTVAQDLTGKRLEWQVANGETMQFSVQDNTSYIAKVRQQDAPTCIAEATFNPFQYVVHHFQGLDNVRGQVIPSRQGVDYQFSNYFYLYVSGYYHTKINRTNYPFLNVFLETNLPNGSVTFTYKQRGTVDQSNGGLGVLLNGNNQRSGFRGIPGDHQAAFEAINQTGQRQKVKVTFSAIRPDYDIRVTNQIATTQGVNHESQTVEFFVDPL